MALSKITKNAITDAAVEKEKIKADAIDATKIADDAISEEHLDNTVITGKDPIDMDAKEINSLKEYLGNQLIILNNLWFNSFNNFRH